MAQLGRLVRVILQGIGAIAIVGAIAVLFTRNIFKDFANGNWIDSDEQLISSPHGLHTIRSVHRTSGPEESFLVFLNNGDPNRQDQYTLIVEIRDVASRGALVSWEGDDHLLVKYPSSAVVVTAYAKTRDVRIMLSPPLPSENPK